MGRWHDWRKKNRPIQNEDPCFPVMSNFTLLGFDLLKVPSNSGSLMEQPNLLVIKFPL
jgi:hypothetical protein